MTPKLPRDVPGNGWQKLSRYSSIRSRVKLEATLRLTTTTNGQHHVTIPDHDHLKIGTLSGILGDVAQHLESPKAEIIDKLFR